MSPLRKCFRQTPPWAILLAIGLLACSINAVLVVVNPPAPRVHDEFSYLLAADTFASGRLSNPTHPHWSHFETMHVIQNPSYMSKYPPGQGAVLALGKWLTGRAIAGVCLSTGLAAAACAWMLLAWMPKKWAAMGGLIVAVHSGVQLQWGMSYWGGALAMAAGAAVIGGAGRLAKRDVPLLPGAIGYALGAVGLAVTRPFEGFVLVLAASTVVLVAWLGRRQFSRRRLATHALLPILLIGSSGVVGLLAYNKAVTGSALTMPYMVCERDYCACPVFLWQAPKDYLRYQHEVLGRFHKSAAMWWYDQQQTLDGFVTMKSWLTRCALEFFLPLPLALAMLFVLKGRLKSLIPWLAVGVTVWLAACMTVWMFPHYLAPMAPILLLLIVAGLRNFNTLQRQLQPAWRWLTPGLVGLQVVLFAVAASERATTVDQSWAAGRQAYSAKLKSTPGEDLVFVRYAPDHNVHNEWVYNRADIDASPVVWAREMDPESDAQLIRYFGDRHVWLLMADEQPLRMLPYPSPKTVAQTP